jgi:hypothetical protein
VLATVKQLQPETLPDRAPCANKKQTLSYVDVVVQDTKSWPIGPRTLFSEWSIQKATIAFRIRYRHRFKLAARVLIQQTVHAAHARYRPSDTEQRSRARHRAPYRSGGQASNSPALRYWDRESDYRESVCSWGQLYALSPDGLLGARRVTQCAPVCFY